MADFSKVTMVTIDSEEAGQRVDNYLSARLRGVPKSRIYRILRKGEVRVNKSRVKPEYKLRAGDLLRVPPVRTAEPPPVAVPSQSLWRHLESSILYEGAGLMVVNKPAGMAVHGGDGIDLGLIEAMRQVRSDCRYLELVHRLDKGTSGCVMIAKKRSVLRALQARLRAGIGIEKRYLALLLGRWPERVRQVEQPLKRLELPDGNRIVKVRADGKPSKTQFAVLERISHPQLGELTLVQAKPVTGRTHQIRVHAQFIGHPLLGDSKYGQDAANKLAAALAPTRLCLHAEQLIVPAGDDLSALSVAAPLLPDMSELLDILRGGN